MANRDSTAPPASFSALVLAGRRYEVRALDFTGQPRLTAHDVIDRIVERNRLLWMVLHDEHPDEVRREALERALSPDPFEVRS